MPTFITELHKWLNDHDPPNWIVILVSLFVWPAVLYWWNTRKKQNVPHLELILGPAQIGMNGVPHDAVQLTFTNRTGAVLYLYHVRLRESPKRFPIPLTAARDIAGAWRELKFAVPPSVVYDQHECVLQTNSSATTCIAVDQPMNNAFYSYRSPWWRRYLSRPKYFLVEYTAMAGEKKYSIASVY